MDATTLPAQKTGWMVVDDAANDDSSIVSLHPNTMKELQLSGGDFVLLRSKIPIVGTVCGVLPDDTGCEGRIRMNQVVRQNLGVRLGDVVVVSPCPDIKNGTRINVLPIAQTIAGFTGDLSEVSFPRISGPIVQHFNPRSKLPGYGF